MAHGWAQSQNLTYAGACPPSPVDEIFQKRLDRHLELIRSIGLQEELKFACPMGNASARSIKQSTYDLPSEVLWPSEWRD
jgi:hypothetical protein